MSVVINELKKTNSLINKTINEFHIRMSEFDVNYCDLSDYLKNTKINFECKYSLYEIPSNKKTKIITSNYFTRIVCIGGLIRIITPDYLNNTLLKVSDTYLITPNTPYIIEIIKNSEFIIINELTNKVNNNEIDEKETIYNKTLQQ